MKQKTTYSETELLEFLQRKDEQAFRYLYDHYAAALSGILRDILKEEETVNDTLQQVFLNIWNKIGSYDPDKGRLFTWMLNIARNAAIDMLRSKSFRNQQKNQPLDDTVYTGSVNPSTDEYGLKKWVGTLKTEWRELIQLSYFQGFTQEEIAGITGLPLGTVKTRIRAALTELRKRITES